MLVDIKAFLFNALVYTQSYKLLYSEEQDASHYGRPSVDTEDTERLRAEESPTVAVEQT